MWKHYVYIHRRSDNGTVFYVGKGTKRARDTVDCFDRANRTSSRNKWWWRVVKKHGYLVEIVAMFNSDKDSREFEISLISEYGRANLVNLTDGGDGCAGVVVSQGARKKLSEHAKKPRSDAWVNSIRIARKNGGNGGVVKHGDKLPEAWKAAISNAVRGENNHMHGMAGTRHPTAKPVVNIQSGVFYESITEAADALGQKMQTLHKRLTGKLPNNTLWRFA